MEKYGYEQEDKDMTKEATEKGRCPACGGGLVGHPPVCLKCGSKPFEKRPKHGEDDS